MRLVPALAFAAFVPLGLAQTATFPTEFPPDAVTPSADELRSRLAGQVFRAVPADGNGWRVQFQANGFAYIDTDRGARDSGKWRTEDGRLCNDWQRFGSACDEVRFVGEVLHLKRSRNGEVVTFHRR
jgi:hypothetical protein